MVNASKEIFIFFIVLEPDLELELVTQAISGEMLLRVVISKIKALDIPQLLVRNTPLQSDSRRAA